LKALVVKNSAEGVYFFLEEDKKRPIFGVKFIVLEKTTRYLPLTGWCLPAGAGTE
jgi:hypothetical protein